jgi:transcriptional regulator with XRE-family HTH domain
METRAAFRQHVRYEHQLAARLRLATTRLAEAEQERIWAIVAAHQAGLSIRQIAAATGLSRSRIHQLLQDDEARDIPPWLSQLRAHAPTGSGPDIAPPAAQARLQARVADEIEVLRWCLDWLARLEHGEHVMVNLRPDTEDATAYVRFDQARVRRVLARIAADLDLLARHGPETEPDRPTLAADPRRRHRRRLAEPEAEPQRGRTAKEQREALRKAVGLPPVMATTPTTSAISGGRNRSDVSSKLDGIMYLISPLLRESQLQGFSKGSIIRSQGRRLFRAHPPYQAIHPPIVIGILQRELGLAYPA